MVCKNNVDDRIFYNGFILKIPNQRFFYIQRVEPNDVKIHFPNPKFNERKSSYLRVFLDIPSAFRITLTPLKPLDL